MMGLRKSFPALALLACAVRGDQYPSKFPFENEARVAAAPKAAAPSYTYDESDNGGYMYTYLYAPFTIELPFCLIHNGCNKYMLAVRSGVETRPPARPFQNWNCTAKGIDNIVIPSIFPGDIWGSQVCELGECCSDRYGTYVFWSGVEEDVWQKEYDEELFSTGICSGEITEAHYCNIMGNWGNIACIETFITEVERPYSTGCYDQKFWFFMGCPVYKEVGVFIQGNEPDHYFSDSTGEELMAHTSIWCFADRVCHPYSYYFPEFSKSADSESSPSDSSSNSDATPNSSVDEASSSACFLLLSAVSCVLLLV